MTFCVSPRAHMDRQVTESTTGVPVKCPSGAQMRRASRAPALVSPLLAGRIVDVSRLAIPRLPLSRIQGIVGLAAGLLSIAGFVFSATQTYLRPAPGSGEVVAIVRDAK